MVRLSTQAMQQFRIFHTPQPIVSWAKLPLQTQQQCLAQLVQLLHQHHANRPPVGQGGEECDE